MRLIIGWLAVAAAGMIAVPVAADPVPCDQVTAALARDSDPERVAEELRTTRARINACAKLREGQRRQLEQRIELHQERAERGIE